MAEQKMVCIWLEVIGLCRSGGGCIPKEKLAAIIEIIGELPELGEAFSAGDDGQQYEFPWNDTYNVIKNAEDCTYKMNVTKIIMMSKQGSPWRVLQHQYTGAIQMIHERFIQMIDDKEVDEKNGHTKTEGPLSGKMPGVFWKNNIMALYVMPRREDDAAELVKFLEGIDINEVMSGERTDVSEDTRKEETEET